MSSWLLRLAVRVDAARTVGALLAALRFPVDTPFGTAYFRDARLLHQAAYHGAFETVLLLLERGAHPNLATHTGHVPVILAAMRGHADVMALLASRGADMTRREPGYGNTIEFGLPYEQPLPAETLRSYHRRDYRGDEHAARLAGRLDAALPPPTAPGKRPRL